MGNNIKKDMIRIACTSGCIVVVLLCFLFSSSLAYQFEEGGVARGGTLFVEIDGLMSKKEYSAALSNVDSLISVKKKGLPRFSYFDRFLSERKRYDAINARIELYDLQWKRIEILEASNQTTELRSALEEYVGVIGYNQDIAEAMLKQLNGK